jgi:hypothetical protein
MPDVSTEVAIATTTLGSTGTITFSSIPATYTDLRVVMTCKGASGGEYVSVRLNSDTASNYSSTMLIGYGSAGSFRETSGTRGFWGNYLVGADTTNPLLFTMNLFSYASSTFKTALCQTSNDLNGSGETVQTVGLYRSTSAITTILLLNNAGTGFAAGTTATLYGIL